MQKMAFKNRRWASKGSLLIEAMVILGLVAVLTPVLVSQINERSADKEIENKAGTFLLLQTETENYIKEHYAEIIDDAGHPAAYYIPRGGQKVYTPKQIKSSFYDVFNRKFKVGIKRGANNEVDAMIVEIDEEGDAKRANKVAERVGVSAGVYSDVDRNNAWGVGGLWAEPVSNYFGNEYAVRPGTTVVTTAYNREKKPVFLSTVEMDADLNLKNKTGTKYDLEANTVTAKEICLTYGNQDETKAKCIDEWSFAGFNAVSLVAECRANYLEAKTLTGGKDNSTITWDGNSPSCKKAFEKEFNNNCLQISKAYKNAGAYAPSNLYAVTGTGKSMSTKEVACYFVKGTPPTNAEAIEGCKSGLGDAPIACRYTYETGGSMGKIATSCARIATQYYPNSEKEAPSAFYTLVNGYVKSIKTPSLEKPTDRTYSVPCLFTGRREATPCEAVDACNSNNDTLSSVGCQYAFKKGANTSCATIESVCKAEGKALPEGYYNITYGSGGIYAGKSAAYCFKRCATGNDCSGSVEGASCNLNTKRCFKCTSNASCAVAGHNMCNTTTGACYTYTAIYSNNEVILNSTAASAEIVLKAMGRYKIEVWGQATYSSGDCVNAGYCKGGYTYGVYKMPVDSKISFSKYGTVGFGPSDPWNSGWHGKQGYAAYINGTLVEVAGGAGGGPTFVSGGRYINQKYPGSGGGGNNCGTQGSSSNTGKGGCRGTGGAGSFQGANGGAANGGTGAYPWDNAGGGGGSGYGGGGGGGCGTYTGYGGGGGGGYLRTSSFGNVSYISGGGTTGGSTSTTVRGRVTFLGE